jgi:hypothetical protein
MTIDRIDPDDDLSSLDPTTALRIIVRLMWTLIEPRRNPSASGKAANSLTNRITPSFPGPRALGSFVISPNSRRFCYEPEARAYLIHHIGYAGPVERLEDSVPCSGDEEVISIDESPRARERTVHGCSPTQVTRPGKSD